MKRALLASAAETYVLASAEKIGTASPYVICPLADVDGIVAARRHPEKNARGVSKTGSVGRPGLTGARTLQRTADASGHVQRCAGATGQRCRPALSPGFPGKTLALGASTRSWHALCNKEIECPHSVATAAEKPRRYRHVRHHPQPNRNTVQRAVCMVLAAFIVSIGLATGALGMHVAERNASPRREARRIESHRRSPLRPISPAAQRL